jgi:cell division protein FtsL
MNLRQVIIVVLLGGVIGSALGVVYTTYLSRQLFIELQKAQQRGDDLQVEWGQLLLEQGTLATHSRIEGVAGVKLGMRLPPTAAIEVLRP